MPHPLGDPDFRRCCVAGAVKSVLESSRIAREAELIEDLFREISKDGKAAYGIKEVQTALNYVPSRSCLVLDELARRGRVDETMREVAMRAEKVVIFSSEFEPGERLRSLGGVAALLRSR